MKQWRLATVMRGNVNYEKQRRGIETTEGSVRDRLMKCQSCNDTNNNDQQTKNSYTTKHTVNTHLLDVTTILFEDSWYHNSTLRIEGLDPPIEFAMAVTLLVSLLSVVITTWCFSKALVAVVTVSWQQFQ